MPNTVTIAGSLYNASTGAKITSGTIYITPKKFIPNGRDIIVPVTASYTIPGSGDISLSLSPDNGIEYVMEFDPNPADTTTPLRLKDGYFTDTWTVPANYQWTVANTSGLVGYWTLGEANGTTATDYAAGAHNGTYSGGFTLNVASGLADGTTAATFDGVNGLVTVAHYADLNFGSGAFSVECWIKLNSGAGDPKWALGKGTPESNVSAGFGLKVTGVTDPVPAAFYISDGAAGANTSGSPINLTRNAWHHLAFVVDRSTSIIKGYLDGAVAVSGVTIPGGVGSVNNGAASLTLGQGNGNYYAGTLDEVAIYNRILTATEVAAHYALRTRTTIDINSL